MTHRRVNGQLFVCRVSLRNVYCVLHSPGYRGHCSLVTMSVPTGSSPVLEHGHVRLILLEEQNSSFYLDIPLGIIVSLCLNPLKYLVFLGWCILGVEGVLARECGGDDIGTDGHLYEQEIYYYVGPEDAGTFSLTMSLLLCACTEYL
jgi:hypothetical protein